MQNLRLFEQFISEGSSDPKSTPSFRIWSQWRTWINMSPSEIERFLNSDQGKEAGLSRKEAKKEGGIKTGRDSARALVRMIPIGSSWRSAVDNWSPNDWQWARRQVSFNSRMSGMRPTTRDPYLEKDGEYTDWMKSMLIWGHDPRKSKRALPREPKDLDPKFK
jgi:hypothetical protein